MEFSRCKFIVSRRIAKKIVVFHVCLSWPWPTVVYVHEQSVWTPTLYCFWMRILFRVSKVSWLVQIHRIDLSAAEPKMHNRGSAVNHFLSAKRQFFFWLFSLQIIIFVRWLTVNGTCRVVKSSFVPKYLKTSFCQVYVQFDRATHANQSKIISAFFSPFLYLLCLRDVADAGSD